MKLKRRPRSCRPLREVQSTDDVGVLELYAMKQADIAVIFGVSKCMVQKIEERAVRKIIAAVKAEAAAEGVSVMEWLYA